MFVTVECGELSKSESTGSSTSDGNRRNVMVRPHDGVQSDEESSYKTRSRSAEAMEEF